MAALTDEEKERIRYHLGYMESSFAASLQLGIPRPVQTIFLVEQAMVLLTNEYAIDRVRRVLWTLDQIESKLQSALCSMIAEQLGDLKLRADYPDKLEAEYVRWAKRLADIFGVPLYPYSDRFKPKVKAGNLSVRG